MLFGLPRGLSHMCILKSRLPDVIHQLAVGNWGLVTLIAAQGLRSGIKVLWPWQNEESKLQNWDQGNGCGGQNRFGIPFLGR